MNFISYAVPVFLLLIAFEVILGLWRKNNTYRVNDAVNSISLGTFEWFMVTPSNHRVHPAQNVHYIDKNYGGLLIIWDRLFGTFIEEDEHEEVIYGIAHRWRVGIHCGEMYTSGCKWPPTHGEAVPGVKKSQSGSPVRAIALRM